MAADRSAMNGRGLGLTVAGQPQPERADAARNRKRIIDAAQRIVRSGGVEALYMEEVAQAAGVGVGTVYRRFGDRAGLAYALLDEREVELQQAFLAGPPPLGFGAPPVERIKAFLHALLDRLQEQSALLLVAETNSPHARYVSGAYRVHHAHLAGLVEQVRPGSDARYLADALLAPIGACLVTYQQDVTGMSLDRIKSGLDDLVDAISKPEN
ncbi:TetR/AcrR family transcriptional regulator [Saccharopolyspora taberi]|uniref:TetR/AcrR family transcriptional regulator n=1 Tax=Saccharopolyspora taberi TaxID=60895 RepID=A0ABN3VJE0_9PSEU